MFINKKIKMINDSCFVKFISKQFVSHDTQNILMVFLSVLSIASFLQWLIRLYKELRSLPPGPWGFPVIGYLFFMGNEKHTRFMELAKQYGSLFSTRLGNQLTVVLSDYKLIRECFRRDDFSGRPDTPLLQTLNGFGEKICFNVKL